MWKFNLMRASRETSGRTLSLNFINVFREANQNRSKEWKRKFRVQFEGINFGSKSFPACVSIIGATHTTAAKQDVYVCRIFPTDAALNGVQHRIVFSHRTRRVAFGKSSNQWKKILTSSASTTANSSVCATEGRKISMATDPEASSENIFDSFSII